MLALLLALSLCGIEEDEFTAAIGAMAKAKGCEVQTVMEDDGGDVRIVTFTCPDSRRAVLWARGESGWHAVRQFSASFPSLPRGSGI